ncbi:MAG: hypothetical protein ABSA97_07130 [Verrucomicrobiia bacterium]
MRAKQWIGLCAIAAIVAGFSARVSAQITNEVTQVQMVLSGLRENDTLPPYSKKLTVTGNNLVNLALGNAPGSPVPTNQVLALVHENQSPGLVVYDTSSGSVLAEISIIGHSRRVAAPSNVSVKTSRTQTQFTGLLTIENVGSDTNGLIDGNLMLVGTVTLGPDGESFVKANLTVGGWLDVTVTDSGGTHQQTVVFPKGTFVTTRHLGMLIEPSPVIGLSTNTLSFTATAGGPNPPPQSFTVCNNGPARPELEYTIDTSSTNVVVSPSKGILKSGECQFHVVTVNLNGTPAGTYTGTLTISDPDAANDPQTIEGTLTVSP